MGNSARNVAKGTEGRLRLAYNRVGEYANAMRAVIPETRMGALQTALDVWFAKKCDGCGETDEGDSAEVMKEGAAV